MPRSTTQNGKQGGEGTVTGSKGHVTNLPKYLVHAYLFIAIIPLVWLEVNIEVLAGVRSTLPQAIYGLLLLVVVAALSVLTIFGMIRDGHKPVQRWSLLTATLPVLGGILSLFVFDVGLYDLLRVGIVGLFWFSVATYVLAAIHVVTLRVGNEL
ncbi:MAG: hypothetical protein SV377_07550 [Halobacteria archaeon]|nr:hypothetical protein [Halobacteria archaeon]